MKKRKPDILKIIGKKVIDVRGWLNEKERKLKAPIIKPAYILFDDGKTFIALEEQDYYTYHDCNSWAREIYIKQDKVFWERIKKDKKSYPKATEDIC